MSKIEKENISFRRELSLFDHQVFTLDLKDGFETSDFGFFYVLGFHILEILPLEIDT